MFVGLLQSQYITSERERERERESGGAFSKLDLNSKINKNAEGGSMTYEKHIKKDKKKMLSLSTPGLRNTWLLT